VAVRVSPTEAIRAQIHELFESGGELLSVVEQVARLSVRLTFQSVIEEIICEELGRGRYERRSQDLPEGYRNGWQQPRTLKTSLGPVELQRPKLRHAHAALCDQLFGQGVTRTNALETLVISCWVRGLSDRDVEAMLSEVFGEQATISRSTVSRICQRLRAEFDAWCRRDLSKTRVDYLYLDGSFLQAAPQGQGRAGAGGLGDRHLRQAGVPGSGARDGRVDRCLARAAGGPGQLLDQLRIAATLDGYRQLRQWAGRWPQRCWAVEGAHGIGRALAQRLVGDGEQVMDVPAKLAARVRVLSVGHGRKSDGDDAVSVAVAARSVPQLRQVGVEDQATVLHLLTKRRQDLVAARTQTINRLHRLLMDLVPGGARRNLTAKRPTRCWPRSRLLVRRRSPAGS
jgi:hypothetical protein